MSVAAGLAAVELVAAAGCVVVAAVALLAVDQPAGHAALPAVVEQVEQTAAEIVAG